MSEQSLESDRKELERESKRKDQRERKNQRARNVRLLAKNKVASPRWTTSGEATAEKYAVACLEILQELTPLIATGIRSRHVKRLAEGALKASAGFAAAGARFNLGDSDSDRAHQLTHWVQAAWNAVMPMCDQSGHIPDGTTEKLRLIIDGLAKNVEAEPEETPSAAVDIPVAPVVLKARGEKPIVLGKAKTVLTNAQYDVVEALLDAPGDKGLTMDQLDKKSGHTEARKILGDLAKSDHDWGAVIAMAGKPGCGYRIRQPKG